MPAIYSRAALAPYGQSYYSLPELESTVGQAILFSFLFCLLTIVTAATVRALARNDLRAWTNRLMLVLLLSMYANTTVMFGIFMHATRRVVNSLGKAGDVILRIDTEGHDQLGYVFFAFFAINAILGDLVLIHRTWVLWRGNKAIVITSILLLLAALITWIIAIVVDGGLYISSAPSMAVSAWSTFAIAFKTSQHWNMRRAQIHIVSKRTKFEEILAVLIESGLAYTILWAVFFGYTVEGAGDEHGTHFGLGWLQIIMSVAVPIYPMWILMVVASAKEESTSAMQLRTLDPVTIAGSEEYKEVRTQESPKLGGRSSDV
ncbi:hypothetical protein PENSPDRAFT_735011 [Peniophora sp. CONT]|nr:hypothetical protein PENSPDRAFT_735011 [Peniophora sp. CONT]